MQKWTVLVTLVGLLTASLTRNEGQTHRRRRNSALENLVCGGQERLTNTLNFLAMMGRSSLSRPLPLPLSTNIGPFLASNATIEGLDSVTIPRPASTECSATDAFVVVPLRLTNVTATVDWIMRGGPVLSMEPSSGTFAMSLGQIDLDIGVTIPRGSSAITVTSVHISDIRDVVYEMRVTGPRPRPATTWLRSRGLSPPEAAVLRTLIRSGLQRAINSSVLPI
ncbi:uncharacterized protein LOC135366281 [Ornithodoros turicata]|uniref:uncharacterized protein LOC135366281 n=1 Tax=Ornithodoros turicata TaxID=34597 RepID=UPI003139DB56